MTAAATSARQAPPNQLRQYQPSLKELATIRARLAITGYQLNEKIQDGGRVIWEVARHDGTRVYSHWGDVLARLAQLGG